MLIDRRKRSLCTLIQALSQGKVNYNPGKIRLSVSREFYQTSCGIEGFLEETNVVISHPGKNILSKGILTNIQKEEPDA